MMRARERRKGFTLIELLIVVAVIGILASIALPSMLSALSRSRQKRTMADLRSLATAIEQYNIDHSMYPVLASESALAGTAVESSLEPLFVAYLPLKDGWNFDFRYRSDGLAYTVGSLAKDGAAGGSLTVAGGGGPTTRFDCDIIISNGMFVQWPEGTQTE
jgi:general secretion pathway protein G